MKNIINKKKRKINMKTHIKYLIMPIFFIMIVINPANAVNDTDDTVKFAIKSKFLAYDKDWNKDIIRINITVDRLGKLTYIEKYYLEGSKSLKFHSSETYFDELLTRKYDFIESIIIFDKKIIFNKTVNFTNRNRIVYSNMSISKSIKTTVKDNDDKNKTKTNNVTNSMTNYTEIKNGKDIDGPKSSRKTNGFDMIIIMLAIYIVYFKFKR